MRKNKEIIGNILYVMKPLIKCKKTISFCAFLKCILKVSIPVLYALITAGVIEKLNTNMGINQLVIWIVSCFGTFAIINMIYKYLEERGYMHFYEVVLELFSSKLTSHFMRLGLSKQEDYKVRLLYNKARKACDDENGIEGMYQHVGEFFAGVVGLSFFSILTGRINVYVLMVIFLCTYLSTLYSKVALNYLKNNRTDLTNNEMICKYILKIMGNSKATKDVRVFELEDWLGNKFEKSLDKIKQISFQHKRLCIRNDIFEILFNCIRDLVIYYVLIVMMKKQQISVVEFLFFLSLINGFSKWIKQIMQSYIQMENDSLLISDYRAFMNITQENSDSSKAWKKIVSETGVSIRFEHVFFRYRENENWVLYDVSFEVESNEHVALVGLNGAGKSTIIKLIAGLYLPTRGNIYINDMNTRDIDIANSKFVGAIFQDPFVTTYSIAENITLNDDCDEAKINNILDQVGLSGKIRNLEKGIFSKLGNELDEGIKLSGGELQKILLARIVYANTGLVLLDEPTSALDALAEEALYKEYSNAFTSKTVVFISHRLSSTRFCDRIMLLKGGNIAEQGNHDELMKSRGEYYDLFNVQRQYYVQA